MPDRTLILTIPPQRGLLEGAVAGIVSLANYVQANDRQTRIIILDLARASWGDIPANIAAALAKAKGLTFVGITTTTASYFYALRTAQQFKQANSECRVILGGHHTSTQHDIVLQRHSDIVDYVIRGEGEFGLAELVRAYPDVSRVPNLSYRSGDTIIANNEAPRLGTKALDAIKPMLQGIESTITPKKFERITYVSARGCPLTCQFCAVRKTKTQSKSVEVVASDLRDLIQIYNCKDIAIEDNFFAQNANRTLQVCDAIERVQADSPFSWDCQTRVESMKRLDVVTAMARAGCDAVYLGVEALVPSQLSFLGKTQSPDHYFETLSDAVIPQLTNAAINVHINLQLGLPGETSADRAMTIRRLEQLARRIRQLDGRRFLTVFPQLHVIYPGTPHFDLAVARQIFGGLGREVFEAFTEWEDAEAPIRTFLGEHFAHGVGGIPIGILDTARLKQGVFEVQREAITTLTRQLERMEKIDGVRVFRYGEYLARPTHREAAVS